ncbi:acid-sensing (proton-gated) ion channel, variant 2 [Chamberlinius hualienensis]
MYFWNSGSNGEDATVTKLDAEKWIINGSHDNNFITRLDTTSPNKQLSKSNKLPLKHNSANGIKSADNVQNDATAMGMLRDFAQNTSLPGVGHVYGREGWYWKLFWFLISIGAAAMAIIQSWRILNDFAGGKTIQSTSYSTEFDFPAITICSNIRLHYRKKGMIDDLDLSYLNRDNYTHLMAFVDLLLLKENETGDDPFGPPLSPKNCIYNQVPCDKKDDDEIFHFDTPLFGNCFTYNIGTKKSKEGKANYFLTMKVPMDKFSRRLDWNENFIQVWLHPPGTAPVLYRHEGIRVYPGDSVDIKFQMKKITRLPKKGRECLDPKGTSKRFESIFHTENDPYLYSSRACSYSLLYETKKDLYSCMDPAIPRNAKWREEWQTGHYNMCLPVTHFVIEQRMDGGVYDDKYFCLV